MMKLLRLAALLGLVSLLGGCKGGSGGNSAPSSPPPSPAITGAIAPPRRQFDFGYFYCDWQQPAETADHVTIVHVPSGGDWATAEGRQRVIDAAIIMLGEAKRTGIQRAALTMDFCGWDAAHQYLGPAEAYRRAADFLRQISEAGLLDMVVALYTVDEPEREVDVSSQELVEFCGVLRDVSARFSISPALAIIYGDGAFGGRGIGRGIEAHDWIGRDAYDEGTGALGEPYSDLADRLLPHQRLILVPGVASPWRADLAPWYERAQSDDRVAWLAPFDWVGYAGQPNGARNNGMADHCRAYGRAIKGA